MLCIQGCANTGPFHPLQKVPFALFRIEWYLLTNNNSQLLKEKRVV